MYTAHNSLKNLRDTRGIQLSVEKFPRRSSWDRTGRLLTDNRVGTWSPDARYLVVGFPPVPSAGSVRPRPDIGVQQLLMNSIEMNRRTDNN